ncbi:transcription termination factor MTEF18, mitochondrial-like isoform X1 [Arachis stenosperma]|uniref:transcription termination factor MTEF18, mitochondrial-like isoform X1 n=1 Tax=Arachis stenosperma TaxID=217475 RepID=UPI0025ACCBA3|nr:transcription termination factor MTEF18, mitochondrial-like isoform X1 [Arachis stenosperma]
MNTMMQGEGEVENIPHCTMLFLHRRLCTTATRTKVPSKYKNLALSQAQKILTDYLHSTRSIPYAFADQIAANSHTSLSNLVAKVRFSAPSFSHTLNKFLRYNPINEFEFFFESIGIKYSQVPNLLQPHKFFFSEDGSILDAACVLYEFGFPWDKLGLLYVERCSVFRCNTDELKGRLCVLKSYGFCSVQVIGICLAFPFVFGEQGGVLEAEIDGLLADLRLVFLDFDLAGCVEGNADSWYEVCRKIRVFYNSNGEKGKMGELIGRYKNVILEHGEEELMQKAEYFSRFGVKKEEVARLILHDSELLNFDFETPVINVLKLLKHFGMSSKDLEDVQQNYAHALGTIKMVNLPNVMRALGLSKWFFNRIKDGKHQLLLTYVTSFPNEDQDKGYQDGLKAIRASRTPVHTMNKLNFLHALGFGETALTMAVLTYLNGTSSKLQERFDCLLHLGIEFSKLSKIVAIRPKVLSQHPKIIEKKIKFLYEEMGSSVELLDTFPAFLCFDLENRIKPRFRFYMWMIEKGYCAKNFSMATMIATSDKNFVPHAFRIHPAAPKHWFEQFYLRKLPE